MLTVYRRHLKTCDHRGKGKDKGRDYRRCKCPVWVDGFLSGRDLRQSLKMRDFQKATEKVREWEARGTVEEEKEDAPITIEHACAEFLRDAQARELREPTLYKYRLLFRRLQEFASQRLALCRRVELGDCACLPRRMGGSQSGCDEEA